MTLKDEFHELVNTHLASLEDRFDVELQMVLDHTKPENASVIFFEYDSPHFADDFAIVMHFLAGPFEAEHSNRFLAGATVVPASTYEDEKYECLEPWGLASDLFERWLIDRWKKHKTYPIPAFAGHHDSSYCIRLIDGKKMRWDDVTF